MARQDVRVKGSALTSRLGSASGWSSAALMVAAGLVIAVAVASALGWQPADPVVPDQITPTPPPPARPAQPRAWALGRDVPEVRLPASITLPAQGADAERDAVLREFDQAMGPYRKGRYAESAAALKRLAQRQPDAPEIAFYLGVSRLFAGNLEGALPPLRQARDSTILADEARWFEAVVLERTGHPDEAEIALRPLCDVPGRFEEIACIIVRHRQ